MGLHDLASHPIVALYSLLDGTVLTFALYVVLVSQAFSPYMFESSTLQEENRTHIERMGRVLISLFQFGLTKGNSLKHKPNQS